MKQRKLVTNGWLVRGLIGLGVLLGSARARAEEVVERRVVHEDVGATTETVPNRGLIMSGLFLFGATYAASIIVPAATSDYSPDKKLYVPIAGPWLDLGERKGNCGRSGAPSCDKEDLYQVLIIADGIGQGVGALQVLSGFLFPVHNTVTTEAKWYVVPHLSPYMLGAGAVGTF